MGASRSGCVLPRLRIASTGCVFFILIHVAASANTPPPTSDESISGAETSWHAASKPASGLKMGRIRIKFEETTLADVISATKRGAIQHQGDAAGSVYWLCYTAVTAGNSARLWVEASGEMGGPENRITGIDVQLVANEPPPSDCPLLPKQFARLSFGNGVWLGTTKETVTKVFRSGLLRRGNLAFVGYQGKVSDHGKCEGGYDLLNSFYVTFEAAVVVAINAGQVTSC